MRFVLPLLSLLVGACVPGPPPPLDAAEPTPGFEFTPIELELSEPVTPETSRVLVEIDGGQERPPLPASCGEDIVVRVRSVGELPLLVDSATLSSSTGETTWSLPEEDLPSSLDPGQEVQLFLQRDVDGPGPATSILEIDTDDPASPTTLLLSGIGLSLPLTTVSITIDGSQPPTDVLLINSQESSDYCESSGGGMAGPVNEAFTDLAEGLDNAGVDWRMAGMGGDDPDLVRWPDANGSPLVLPDASLGFGASSAALLWMSAPAQSGSQPVLTPLAQTVDGGDADGFLLRPGAQLVVVAFVKHSVDDPASEVLPTATALDDAVGPGQWTVHASARWLDASALLGPLGDLIAMSGGTTDELCDGVFGPWLDQIIAGAGLSSFLTVPGLGDIVAVRIDGQPLSSWSWDSSTEQLDLGVMPTLGQVVEIDHTASDSCPE